MPQKHAIKEYRPESFYHIYNRGVAKGKIFIDQEDNQVFLNCLKIYLSPIALQGESLKVSPSRQLKNYTDEVKLHCYCLLPNHFHLLVYQRNIDSINFFMRSLATKYSMYFNRKYKRVGPLFQGVYKAVLVTSEEQLCYLSKYIHRNPLDTLPSGRVLEDYKYSSYLNYLGLINQAWLTTEDILSYFSRIGRTNSSYKEFVEEIDERDLQLVREVGVDMNYKESP